MKTERVTIIVISAMLICGVAAANSYPVPRELWVRFDKKCLPVGHTSQLLVGVQDVPEHRGPAPAIGSQPATGAVVSLSGVVQAVSIANDVIPDWKFRAASGSFQIGDAALARFSLASQQEGAIWINVSYGNLTGKSYEPVYALHFLENATENHPPMVAVIRPREGQTFQEGEEVSLIGAGVDPDEGQIFGVEAGPGPASRHEWRVINRDNGTTRTEYGMISNWLAGSSYLPRGNYNVTLSAVDTCGATGTSRTVNFSVIAPFSAIAPYPTPASPSPSSFQASPSPSPKQPGFEMISGVLALSGLCSAILMRKR